ncbi:GntR family transcriptional regulator [Paenibacillus yonginensis]|uniref:GntR family transcriptional regulator n=2 Tax=Paenibacillus TaxID=44249 RepID=A0A1B1N473_9BACL|nr:MULTISPECIES: GntR family transcriptional regulator [Paenibacillus]ANS76241.1 GntR family transcriptional regulator [Paenibacillus yonginensis]GGA42213.1 GntR family transcriptional regulator [Paenibacillus physcomitrellae]
MTQFVYKQIMDDLKSKILAGQFPDMRLPDERSLSEHYRVSRSSVKRALARMEHAGLIFKKQGSGTFINPLYIKNESIFNYEGSNLGVTDNFQMHGQKPKVKVISFEVILPTEELQRDLFLGPHDFVYKIVRLRLFEEDPFMIETGYIPIKIVQNLNLAIIEGSIFNYLEEAHNLAVTKSFLSVFAEPSEPADQELLHLKPHEPVGVMEGIFFLDNGTPFEFSHMRFHYQYMKFNSFVSVQER